MFSLFFKKIRGGREKVLKAWLNIQKNPRLRFLQAFKKRTEKPQREAQGRKKGMTLLEIMIVVGIISMIMAVVMRGVMRRRAKAKINSAKIALNVLSQTLEEFNMDCGSYPENLKDLLDAPSDCGEWDGPYVKEKDIKDPWNSAIIYEYNPDRNSYDLISLGADKRPGGDRNNKDISFSDL